jgi:hypothetical protein
VAPGFGLWSAKIGGNECYGWSETRSAGTTVVLVQQQAQRQAAANIINV